MYYFWLGVDAARYHYADAKEALVRLRKQLDALKKER